MTGKRIAKIIGAIALVVAPRVIAQPLTVSNWASLPAAPSDQKLDLRVKPDNEEAITVYGHRVSRTPQATDGALYEAASSAAAQRLYAASPAWASAAQMRLMSDIKETLGLCGALGGLLTCPKP